MRLLKLAVSGLVVALTAAPALAADKPLNVALHFDPAPLDPATDGSYTNRVVTTLMCDSLIDLSPEMKFVPQLATSWEWAATLEIEALYSLNHCEFFKDCLVGPVFDF